MAAGSPASQALAQARRQGHAIILNSRDASLSLVDRSAMKEVGRVDVGKEPHHLYPTPDGQALIVANAVSNDLHYVDPWDGSIIKRVRNIDDPYQIAISPDGQWFATAALRLDRVDLYAVQHKKPAVGPREAQVPDFQVVKRIAVAKAPSHLWFSPDNKWLFATLQESDEICAIDVATRSLAWRMPVGKLPAGIMLTPDGKYLLVGIMGEDFVNVIDWRTQKSVARIKTGAGAHNFRGLGDQRHVFVGNRVAGTISRIDTAQMSVVATLPLPGGPDCMEVTADRRQLWTTVRWAKQVAVHDIESRKLVATIAVGRSPHGIFFADRAPLL